MAEKKYLADKAAIGYVFKKIENEPEHIALHNSVEYSGLGTLGDKISEYTLINTNKAVEKQHFPDGDIVCILGKPNNSDGKDYVYKYHNTGEIVTLPLVFSVTKKSETTIDLFDIDITATGEELRYRIKSFISLGTSTDQISLKGSGIGDLEYPVTFYKCNKISEVFLPDFLFNQEELTIFTSDEIDTMIQAVIDNNFND